LGVVKGPSLVAKTSTGSRESLSAETGRPGVNVYRIRAAMQAEAFL
jgi:hypothetical protein